MYIDFREKGKGGERNTDHLPHIGAPTGGRTRTVLGAQDDTPTD